MRRHGGGDTLEWWIDATEIEAGRHDPTVTFVAVDSTGEAVGGVTLKIAELSDEHPRSRTVGRRDDRAT
jgi:hypothetical protein